jgi:hypothetical protein
VETKGKCRAEIRQRNPESRNSETQEWDLEGRRQFQISHCERFENARSGLGDPLYPESCEMHEMVRSKQSQFGATVNQPTKAGLSLIKPN